MKYIHRFQTESAFTESYNNEYVEPWVSYTEENQEVNYNKVPRDYSKEYFTIEALESGTIQWNISGNTIEYSLNDGDWTEMDSGTTLNASSGDVFRFRGDNNKYGGNGFSPTINASFSFNTYGNIMSLISSTGFENLTTIPANNCFYGIFCDFMGGCKVADASNLILPATTLAKTCYSRMFYNCSSLTSAPALPATTLVSECYESMFQNCTSLTSAPALPATTLAYRCYACMFCSCTSLTTAPALPATTLAYFSYSNMFADCTSLTTVPELPATTLTDYCYYYMFAGCTSLNYIKCLATDISASYCTSGWVQNVAATGTFVKNPSMGSWETGDNGIPSGWTVQDAS